ncbi:MAG TPA: response regulator [Polyangia bacterium]|nr:response regulator [Polyangia bacterium]
MADAPRIIRVLLIEDNPHVAELITDGLDGAARREMAGRIAFLFDVVGDGQMALERLEQIDPDLIICDVYMPVMDGAAFLRHLRSHAHAARTPVLALSAGGPAAREAAMAAGADVFLDKPIRLNEVLQAAARLLNATVEPPSS